MDSLGYVIDELLYNFIGILTMCKPHFPENIWKLFAANIGVVIDSLDNIYADCILIDIYFHILRIHIGSIPNHSGGEPMGFAKVDYIGVVRF